MPRSIYTLKPLEHAQSTEYPASIIPGTFAGWGAKNFKIDQHSVRKRWGYSADRDLGGDVITDRIVLYVLKGGTRHTLYLTETDLCSKETGASETFSYKTDTGDYDGSIASISSATVTFKASTVADTENIAIGDMFILDADDLSANIEPDTNWGTISAVATSGGYFTSLTLSVNYTGTTGTWTGTEKDCIIRRVYTTPSDERWNWAIVDDKFIFANGDTNVQYWTGSNYAVDLNTSVAIKARYCIEYANRLFIADYGSTRDPLGIAWSKENDPTDWTDSTAGSAQMFETDDYITGLGKSGANIIIYRQDSIMVGNRTGKSTSPVTFPRHRRGVGCVAPYSIVEVMGTNVFLGRDDFYIIRSDYAEPIGEKIRNRFFDIVGWKEIEKTWGFLNMITNEITWVANTSEGKRAFIFNYKNKEWYVSQFADDIVSGGQGAK